MSFISGLAKCCCFGSTPPTTEHVEMITLLNISTVTSSNEQIETGAGTSSSVPVPVPVPVPATSELDPEKIAAESLLKKYGNEAAETIPEIIKKDTALTLPEHLREQAKAFAKEMNECYQNRENSINPTAFFHNCMELYDPQYKCEFSKIHQISAMKMQAFEQHHPDFPIQIKAKELEKIYFNEMSMNEYFPNDHLNHELMYELMDDTRIRKPLFNFLTLDKHAEKRKRNLTINELNFLQSELRKKIPTLAIPYSAETFFNKDNKDKKEFIHMVKLFKENEIEAKHFEKFMLDFKRLHRDLNFIVTEKEIKKLQNHNR